VRRGWHDYEDGKDGRRGRRRDPVAVKRRWRQNVPIVVGRVGKRWKERQHAYAYSIDHMHPSAVAVVAVVIVVQDFRTCCCPGTMQQHSHFH